MRQIRRRAVNSAPPAMETIEMLMKSISSMQDEIARLSGEIKKALPQLQEAMVAGKVSTHIVDDIVAERFCPKGRATYTINPAEFYKLVEEKDFFEAVSVSSTKAKELLPGKALERITSKTGGGLKPEIVEVRHVPAEGKR